MGASPPKISVVVICYNFEKYISECVESIIAQTLKPYEIIICDDHSTDLSWTIIQKYQDKYPNLIKTYRHENNMGPFYNGTFSGEVWCGDYVCLMDGDDRWLPQKLEFEWKALKQYPKADVAYSNVYTIDSKGNRTGIWYDGNGPLPPSGDIFLETFARLIFPDTTSIYRNELVSRHAYHEEGRCDENLTSYWDWDRKIRYSSRFKIVYSGHPLVEYRLHQDGFSKSNPLLHLNAFIHVYEKNSSLLSSHETKVAIRIKVRIESIISERRRKNDLSMTNQYTKYSALNVYNRNLHLLKKQAQKEYAALTVELSPLFNRLIDQIITKATENGNKLIAYRFKLIRFCKRVFQFLLHS